MKTKPTKTKTETWSDMVAAGLKDTTPSINLTAYDIILVNTSAGKDSLAMLHLIAEMAKEQGVLDRVHAVHCDLGRVEWAGTKELAAKQCAVYNVPLSVVSRSQDLLDHVAARGMWPGNATRYCTSDHKRDQVTKLMTRMVNAHIATFGNGQPVRVLNCMGLRAQESAKRAGRPVLETNKYASNGKRAVENWLPIKFWSEELVWSVIRENGLPYHFAYDLGMPRLSCVFCIFAPEEALLLAGYHNRALLSDYVAVEQKINFTFKKDLALVQIQSQLDAGYVPAGKVDGNAWSQCA